MVNQTADSVDADPVPRQEGLFYFITPSFRGEGKGSGLEIANLERLRQPGASRVAAPNGDPGQYPETPHLVQGPKASGMPRDFEEIASKWIVSEALKQVFETVDPQGFAFAACDLTLADGSAGPPYFFCNVIRTLDAVDEAASKLKIKFEPSGRKTYSFLGGASLAFKQAVVGDAHVFRTPYSLSVFCDRVLHDACLAAGVNGVELVDAVDY